MKKAPEVTKSISVHDFKSDFCKMKPDTCRSTLERHHLDVKKLWTTMPPEQFSFIKLESERVKLNK